MFLIDKQLKNPNQSSAVRYIIQAVAPSCQLKARILAAVDRSLSIFLSRIRGSHSLVHVSYIVFNNFEFAGLLIPFIKKLFLLSFLRY